jgi:hypothetical protein
MTDLHRPLREVLLERACSHVSEMCFEPLTGTASTVTDWVLVEQPGAWGQDAVTHSDLPPMVGQHLRRQVEPVGARLLLIRRPGRDRGSHPRALYLVHSGPDAPWRRRLEFLDPFELLDLDVAAAFADPGGRSTEALYAVCTNGKHDLCCAVKGFPLARAIAGLGDVWHCSHVGGDRFAGNLVCFPEGLYYGRVTPADGPAVVAAHGRGEIVLAHFRGRSCQPFAVQAADHFVRTHRRLTRLRDVRLIGRSATDGAIRCDFELPGAERVSVTVATRPALPARRLTCRGEDVMPPAYDVRWLDG